MTVRKFNGVLRKLPALLVAGLVAWGLVPSAPASAAAQSGTLTINFHYQRADQNFADAKAWIWCKDGSGNFGTGLYQLAAVATGDCKKGAYLSLHSVDKVSEMVAQFTITDAVDVSQLGVIMYKAAGSTNCCGTRDAQSSGDRLFDLVAAGTDVVASVDAPAITTSEYVVPTPTETPSPTDSPSPTDTPSPTDSPTDSPSPDPTAPGAPTGVVASPGNAQVVLTWPAVESATGYQVFREDQPDNAIASPTEPTFTDTTVTNGVTYTYWVVASNEVGFSEASATVTAKPVAPVIAPAPPSITSFSQSKATKRGVGTVTVIGKNLSGATVKVGGYAAVVNKKLSSATKLVFTIPAKAKATSQGTFVVTIGKKSVTSKAKLKITLK